MAGHDTTVELDESPAALSRSAEKDKGAAAANAGGARRRKIILLVLLLAAAGWAGEWWFTERFIESTDNAYLQADSVTVAPKVMGYVTEVLVKDNQTVSVGQPLVRLDSRYYQAALDQANATIAARRADIVRVEAELLQQQSTIAQSRAQLNGSTGAADYAEARVERYEPLIAKGGETADKLAELRNSSRQAKAALAADRAALQSAERQVATTAAQLQLARAQLVAAEAGTRQNKIDLDDTVVRSTMAGRVGDRTVRAGQYVQAGTKLMTIVPVKNIYLVANFKETQIGAIRVGQPVSIKVDALPGVILDGTVDSLAPGTGSQFALLPPENATGNFTKVVQRVPVRVRLSPDSLARHPLVPGLSVTARVDTHVQAPAASMQPGTPGHG